MLNQSINARAPNKIAGISRSPPKTGAYLTLDLPELGHRKDSAYRL